MRGKLLVLGLVSGLVCVEHAFAQAPTDRSGEMVDALEGVFGKHKVRASYAKGQCVVGTFMPFERAQAYSSSVIFSKTSRVIGRFSMGGGNPTISDSFKMQPRGLAIQIDPRGPGETHFAMNAAPMQPANTVDEWIENMRVRAPGPDGKPDPQKIAAFNAAKPHTKHQGVWLASRGIPASYATSNYWAVHAYTMTSAAGKARMLKIKFVPTDGEYTISDAEAATRPRDWLVAELAERLKKGPVTFEMMGTFARPGDKSSEPAILWDSEETRPTVRLGRLSITRIEKNEVCDATVFNGAKLAPGLAGPKDDELFMIRERVYYNSSKRRDPPAKISSGESGRLQPTSASTK